MYHCYILTLTDDIIPAIVGIVFAEKEAIEWRDNNYNKHKGWMNKYQWPNYYKRPILSEGKEIK